MVEDMRN